jgi:hypothetical protein
MCRDVGLHHMQPIPPRTFVLIIAAAVTLGGTWVQWRAHDYRMEAEEALKDRRLTSDQASRRLLLIRGGGAFLTCGGMAILVICMLLPED